MNCIFLRRGYEASGDNEYTLVINDSIGVLEAGFSIEVNGTSYPKGTTLTLNSGTTVRVINDGGAYTPVRLNGTTVAEIKYGVTYDFQITANTTIDSIIYNNSSIAISITTS